MHKNEWLESLCKFENRWKLGGACYSVSIVHDVHLCIVYFSKVALQKRRRKRAWYTPFAHAQFPLDFWEFGNFREVCSITLTSVKSVSQTDFSRIKPAIDHALRRQ